MAIKLEKGQRINLEKNNGTKLLSFCVGCNWGAIEKKTFFGLGPKSIDVDLDLSCIMVNQSGEICDHIYSPLYNAARLSQVGLPAGKLNSQDGALQHSGDDLQGDVGGDDGLDNEIITVNLPKVLPTVQQIFFFLNICGGDYDFSQIPYATIRMYEGTPSKVQNVFAQYDVAATSGYVGKYALIMGKLYRKEGEWRFAAIGDAHEDRNFTLTLFRILKDYVK